MVEEKESIVALATALATVRNSDAPFARVYDGLDEIEQLIFQHKEACGIQNVQFQLGCEEFLLLCNTAAIQHLEHADRRDELAQCGDLLTRAEQHTRRAGYLRSIPEQSHVTSRVQLRLLCLNNLACYNKHIDKPLLAISFLEKALEIQLQQTGDTEGATENAIALTHLNLCAVLSRMRRHDAAAEHARSAIDLLQQLQERDANADVDVNVLVIAHYNLAVELEHLNALTRAAAASTKGIEIARAHGLDRASHEAVRLLEEMCHSHRVGHTAVKSPRSLSPRRVNLRPPSPRTLRQRT